MTAERIREFHRFIEEGISDRRVPTTHGIAYLADAFPNVYDANYLSVAGAAAPAAALADEADTALEGRFHRRISVQGGGVGLHDELAELGFELSTHLVLAHTRPPDRLADTTMIREVPFDELLAARTAATLAESWGSPSIAAALDDAKRRVAATLPTRFFAPIVDGGVAGYCELRERDGVAQIEDVEILAPFRGRGLGRAVVQAALQEGLRRNELVWLEALADDWPRELYAKLGFGVVDRRDVYTRLPHPLTRLRLRTPRLELRLATVAELRALYRVAAAGIHDPAFMPFGVAWTDGLGEDGFLAFHAAQQASWSPDDWHLELVVFREGVPIGAQGIFARNFAAERAVSTGSWLGRPWQRHGLGTEMRSAVLHLAFDLLKARVAHSGAIFGNDASFAVSRKLGYRQVGTRTVTPRGEPVEHADLELQAEDFSSPVAVESDGLDPSLFGV